jgi:hypothetical protein
MNPQERSKNIILHTSVILELWFFMFRWICLQYKKMPNIILRSRIYILSRAPISCVMLSFSGMKLNITFEVRVKYGLLTNPRHRRYSSDLVQCIISEIQSFRIYENSTAIICFVVSTTEELLGRKSSGSGLGNREYGRRDPSRWPRGTLYQQKVRTNFVDKRLSLGRYSLFADSSHRDFFYLLCDTL